VRILFTIHHGLAVNTGAPGATLALVAGLRDRGHDVDLLSHDDLPSSLGDRARQLAFPALVRRRARAGYDLVDASTGDGHLMPRGNHRGPALVTRSHGLEHVAHEELLRDVAAGTATISWKYPLFHGGLRLRQVRRSIELADLTLVLNRRDRSVLETELGIAPARIRVVRNGVPPEVFGPRPVAPATEGPLTVAFIGHFGVRKGAPALRLAMGEFLADTPAARFRMLGVDAAEQQQFAPRVREQIECTPSFERAALPVLLEGVDVLVLPSVSEGQSLALTEAMANGLATITTAAAAGDLVRPDVDGLLVEARDPAGIVTALRRLDTDRGLLRAMRVAAWERARTFTWPAVVEELETIYDEVLGDR